MKLTKPKLPTITNAKKRAYHAFQIYLRTKWTKYGFAQCYTCSRPFPFEKIQVGHWVTGHTNATYINESYVRPQCWQCNIGDHGNQGEFRDRLRTELGDHEVDKLLRASKIKVIIPVTDYLTLETEYKVKLDLLLHGIF